MAWEDAFTVKRLTDQEIKEMYFDNQYYREGELCVICFVRGLEKKMIEKVKNERL
jgi:hypothetical protein